MRFKIVILSAVGLFSIVLTGCGGPAANENTAANNANTANANAVPTAEVVRNNAPTLTPVLRAYCDAWVKGDEAGLRKVYSSATLKHFESLMKEDKQKSLIKFLEDEKVSGNPCRMTNEEITGDKAVGTIFLNKYPRGIEIEFVKENGEWKMTNRSSALTNVTDSASNSNTAK